jgi:shikimate dehydrogenase
MLKKFPHRLYGLIGNPVYHSLSLHMHNAAFAEMGIDAAYLPFLVEKGKVRQAISALRQLGVSGFNVTVPFKTECMRYLDAIDPMAKAIGAVNTVVDKKGKLIGYNTDCPGFLKSLRNDLDFDPKDKNIFLLGAGGAARAVAFGLAKSAVRKIIINDIVISKSKSLARDIRKNFQKVDIVCSKPEDIACLVKGCQLLVNCTPIGMNPKDPSPVNIKFLHKAIKIYDIVYTPLRTSMVRHALKKSIQSTNGLNMLLYQGVLAFELWTGKKAPIALMRKELLDNLKC